MVGISQVVKVAFKNTKFLQTFFVTSNFICSYQSHILKIKYHMFSVVHILNVVNAS